jgi:branched-chain amino acid transport system substrate-binding protein
VTSSEDEAQQCAQKFLNDSAVNVVLQGGLNVGADAVHTTINGTKPTVIALANPGSDATAANAFAVNPGALAALPGFATYSVAKGYKNIALVVSSNPGDLAIAQLAQGIFSGKGVKTKITTFPAGSTDLTSAYTAALADKPDAVTPVVATTAGCTATAKALQAIGTTTPVEATGLCATDDIKKALGDFPKWAYESTTLSLYASDSTGQMAFYKAVMAKYAGANAQLGIDAPVSFGAAFALAKVLNGIGGDKVSAASVSEGMKGFTGPVLLGAPKIQFGSVPSMPTLSGVADRFFTYTGEGKWTATDWQSLPQ